MCRSLNSRSIALNSGGLSGSRSMFRRFTRLKIVVLRTGDLFGDT